MITHIAAFYFLLRPGAQAGSDVWQRNGRISDRVTGITCPACESAASHVETSRIKFNFGELAGSATRTFVIDLMPGRPSFHHLYCGLRVRGSQEAKTMT